MNIFDMNVHLAPDRTASVAASNQAERAQLNLKAENTLLPDDYLAVLDLYAPLFRTSFQSANFMFFSPAAFRAEGFPGVLDRIRVEFPGSTFTALLDFRTNGITEDIELLGTIGFKGIKFHPYNQRIIQEDWESILQACKQASALGLVIFVCTSFGTAGMHRHDGLGLACRIAESIQDTPIVLLHAGGVRLYEAMLLADACPNVYLETSFTLNYLRGSGLLQEFMFIFRKIGSKRVCFGSDFPYVAISESLELLQQQLSIAKFSAAEIDNIMGATARQIMDVT